MLTGISEALLNAAALASAFVLVYTLLNKFSKTAPLPPGPRKLPLIGNLLDIPREREWVTFTEWAAKWGDIVSVSVLGEHMIILNTAQAAFEMLDKKSAKFSDRPVLELAGEIVGWKNTVILLPYGEEFRAQRKAFHQAIGSKNSMSHYYPIVEKETHKFLKRVLAEPVLLDRHVRRMSAAILIRITYGYELQEGQDPLLTLAEDATAALALSTAPTVFMVNVIPALRYVPAWLPGGGYKNIGAKWAKIFDELVNRPYEWVKKQMKLGTANPSVTSRLLDETAELTPERERHIKWSAASLYGGGADTTMPSIITLFLAMALYPDVMRKAQEEIDAVIGQDRLPSFSDRENLPYTNALVLEIARWHTVAPTAVHHSSMEDDIYNGYLIPKGAMIIPNIWYMLHDPKVYPDPFEFKPERFLGPNPEPDPYDVCFGFGRRICPGRVLADASVFLSCAMSLAVFNITKLSENGETITPIHEQLTGSISQLKPFKCAITPRSSQAQVLIDSEI
ncbi:unnamed protein product [Cyclocybe aegerita]|uniref:Cytochrome P450 n=1 Tax=Cyclocybe aegerita TaxID=1973307 RepID=A0A8S0X3U9_CYCAE|nr:unnamed protein product [Cyclocybe aegerita]